MGAPPAPRRLALLAGHLAPSLSSSTSTSTSSNTSTSSTAGANRLPRLAEYFHRSYRVATLSRVLTHLQSFVASHEHAAAQLTACVSGRRPAPAPVAETGNPFRRPDRAAPRAAAPFWRGQVLPSTGMAVAHQPFAYLRRVVSATAGPAPRLSRGRALPALPRAVGCRGPGHDHPVRPLRLQEAARRRRVRTWSFTPS